MKISQRDIIELNFELPNGKLKSHPALVISNQNVLDTEDIFYAVMISTKAYNDDFTGASVPLGSLVPSKQSDLQSDEHRLV